MGRYEAIDAQAPLAQHPDVGGNLSAAAVAHAPRPAPDLEARPRVRLIHDQRGTTLIELLLVLTMLGVAVGATFAFLITSTREQGRDQAFGQEVASTQAALTRFTHDLRSAIKIVSAAPNEIEFLLRDASGVTNDIAYDCSRPDSLGGGFRRCARRQSVYPTALPPPSSSSGALDIQHVANGSIANYCNAAGTLPSGSAFFFSDPAVPNTNVSPPACDENYEGTIASLAPPYVQVTIMVPASGDLINGGLTHTTTFATAVYLRNQDSGA